MSIVIYGLARSKGNLRWRIFEASITVENVCDGEDNQKSCEVENRCDDPVSWLSARSAVRKMLARIPRTCWTVEKTFCFFWLLQILYGHSKSERIVECYQQIDEKKFVNLKGFVVSETYVLEVLESKTTLRDGATQGDNGPEPAQPRAPDHPDSSPPVQCWLSGIPPICGLDRSATVVPGHNHYSSSNPYAE